MVGSGTVESLLKGKQYNRAVRVLKTVFEALQRLKLDAFTDWLQGTGNGHILVNLLESKEFNMLVEERNQSNMENASEEYTGLFSLWEKYEEVIRQNKLGPMAVFWQSFLDMVETMLDYIKSIRVGDLELHLQAMERMLKWYHAYDHTNYARHFTYCWATQQSLEERHPTIYQEFRNGNFSVKRTAGKFNMLPPDQVIEQTVNKEQKGPGGIIGFSTSLGTVQRWILTSHVIATISSRFKETLGLERPNVVPKDFGKKRILYDEASVSTCYELINSWRNPFNDSTLIIGLSSGLAAPKEIQNDLLNAADVGKKQLKDFLVTRIEATSQHFHDPIKKNKLKTFSSIDTKPIKVNNTTINLKSDRETFARLLVVQQNRRISLQDVLKFELSSFPLALANPDGTMTKTMKVKLFQSLQDKIPTIPSCRSNTPNIFDGMVLLQKLPPNLETFGNVSDYLLTKVLKGSARIVYFVTDPYFQYSSDVSRVFLGIPF